MKSIALIGTIILMFGSEALAFDKMEQATGSKKVPAVNTSMEQLAGPNTRPVSTIKPDPSSKPPNVNTSMEQLAGPNTRPAVKME